MILTLSIAILLILAMLIISYVACVSRHEDKKVRDQMLKHKGGRPCN